MQNDNTIPSQTAATFTLTAMPGVEIVIAKESLTDYLEARAAQLAALNHLLMSGDFEGWDENIKSDAKWLAASLATEVSKLASVVTFRENLE
ncbi:MULTISPECIES: hypothetical protein [unclassified Duganella]|uniref:hypothetical protein n=1 Tax=unclassified Duganella TaxID=2636909 RepID=UPI000888DF1F|nr:MULTISPECIES: hypothetical protein [unclassified Duganella]SDH05483.1 hypothetical protein SAMN05216320_109127 [Duganella sp. OV458]SDK20676.1 hypothetical protein SAMN05428973_109155 [Duganella sp. OV510]